MNRLITIVTPCFNKENFIEATIQSVIKQTYTNWELLLIDDASTDYTAQIATKYAQSDSRIKAVINTGNRGANYCRNKGIELASGEFLIFLDADDVLTPNCLETRLKAANKNETADAWIFAMGAFYRQIGDAPDNTFWRPKKGNHLVSFLSHQLPWSICQPMWKSVFLKNSDGFDTQFHRLQDVEFHTRALLNGLSVHISEQPSPDCYYRIAENRNTENQLKQYQRKSESAIQYYRKFFALVPLKYRPKLTGTLIEALGALLYARRNSQICVHDCKRLAEMLINCCELRSHQRLLTMYLNLDLSISFHPRGLKFLIRKLAGN